MYFYGNASTKGLKSPNVNEMELNWLYTINVLLSIMSFTLPIVSKYWGGVELTMYLKKVLWEIFWLVIAINQPVSRNEKTTYFV